MPALLGPEFAASRPSERLKHLLEPLADIHHLRTLADARLYGSRGDDWVVTALVVTRPGFVSARGVEGAAALVVDLGEAGSELAQRFRFYESCDVQEVLLVNPDTKMATLYRRRGRLLQPRQPRFGRWLHLTALQAWVSATARPTLRVRWHTL
jgi:hypothetical protein